MSTLANDQLLFLTVAALGSSPMRCEFADLFENDWERFA